MFLNLKRKMEEEEEGERETESMCAHAYPQRPKEALIRSSRPGVPGGCEPLEGALGSEHLSTGPLQRQCALLTTELSLQTVQDVCHSNRNKTRTDIQVWL